MGDSFSCSKKPCCPHSKGSSVDSGSFLVQRSSLVARSSFGEPRTSAVEHSPERLSVPEVEGYDHEEIDVLRGSDKALEDPGNCGQTSSVSSPPSNLSEPEKSIVEGMVFLNGLYSGEVVGQRPHGEGVHCYSATDNLSGRRVFWRTQATYEHGERCGYGTEECYRQESDIYDPSVLPLFRYEGDYLADLFHGEGKASWIDGRRYEGQWASGKMHGQGTFYARDFSIYSGGFRQDEFHGLGCWVHPVTGQAHMGEYDEGLRHGQGVQAVMGRGDRDTLRTRSAHWAYGKMMDKKAKFVVSSFASEHQFEMSPFHALVELYLLATRLMREAPLSRQRLEDAERRRYVNNIRLTEDMFTTSQVALTKELPVSRSAAGGTASGAGGGLSSSTLKSFLSSSRAAAAAIAAKKKEKKNRRNSMSASSALDSRLSRKSISSGGKKRSVQGSSQLAFPSGAD